MQPCRNSLPCRQILFPFVRIFADADLSCVLNTLSTHHAAKANVAGGGINRLGMASGGAKALAVVDRAQVRAALEDLATYFHLRLPAVQAAFQRAAARIGDSAAGLWSSFLRLSGVILPPVTRPFSNIADHVV